MTIGTPQQPLLSPTAGNYSNDRAASAGSLSSLSGVSSSQRQEDYGSINQSPEHESAEMRNPSSATETFFHIVCITAGTGILQLPYALKEGGWIGAFYILLAAAISAYSGNILIECLYYMPGVRLKSYSEVVEAAFGLHGRRVVRLLKDFNLLGVVGIYMVLAGINIDSLVAGTVLDRLGVQFWIGASALLIWIVIVLAHRVHDVFVLSIFGTLTTVATVAIIVWLGISDMDYRDARPPTKFVDLKLAPISLASICFSFGGNLNWPDLEASMRAPKQWSKTLNLATVFIAFIYLCIAVVGYGVYGDLVKSPILLSLPPGIAVVVANAMLTAHVLLASPILLTAVFIEAEHDLDFNSAALEPKAQWLYRVAFRSALMLLLSFFAVFVSDFSKVVPILGAVAASLVVFVIPVACYMRLFKSRGEFSSAEYGWCGFIIAVGLMCLAIGTSQALANL
ncbi:hypothetical protein J3B02_001432 [Coemansia erecta]|uniref:Amino acid transporter transmembrane domain-containing protein n=1 Tax=Coemansia asiatica TaxID=1052880 RepID=A0A9W8CJ17_9FUNG|nr:hypothetical protein LPJ64_003992 [Coemansia asiatica]KAJ2856736.1 hypothetical protein J3B02_001432 [Coemansia erecta]KAJ2888255.1 hypothetical protein FB639_000765 [Coemansia asiatica]